jgi:hypothetical protein
MATIDELMSDLPSKADVHSWGEVSSGRQPVAAGRLPVGLKWMQKTPAAARAGEPGYFRPRQLVKQKRGRRTDLFSHQCF